MAKSSTQSSTSPTSTTKKTRTRHAQSYLATIADADPVIVIAHSHKAALQAVITLKPATPAQLMAAGKDGYRVIDTTAPAQSNVSAFPGSEVA